MTTTAQAVEAIFERWAANTSLPVTSYGLDNEEFSPQALTTWANLVVRHTGSEQRSIGPVGSRIFERLGVVVIQHGVARDVGRAGIDALVQESRAIFEGKSFSGIFVRNCPVREVGNVGKWFQVNVEVAFYYEELK